MTHPKTAPERPERIALSNGTYFRPVNCAFEDYNKNLWVLCGKSDDDRISVGWTKQRVDEFVATLEADRCTIDAKSTQAAFEVGLEQQSDTSGAQWQPITEAHKEAGLLMLAWPNRNGGYVRAMGYYVKRHTWEDTGDADLGQELDVDEHGTAFFPEGWYSFYNFDEEVLLSCKPTLCAIIPLLPVSHDEGAVT